MTKNTTPAPAYSVAGRTAEDVLRSILTADEPTMRAAVAALVARFDARAERRAKKAA